MFSQIIDNEEQPFCTPKYKKTKLTFFYFVRKLLKCIGKC